MVAPDDCPSQADYIKYFDDAIAVMQTEAALERIAHELCVDSAAENIDYLEVRWAPRLHLRQGLTIEQVIQAVLSGLDSGPIEAVAIVCAMRHHTPEENVALAREAGRFAGRGVVGFDLAGDEVRYPASPQRPAFEAARVAGLRLTCHAGEAGDPSSVEEALGLGVERIAHGVIGAREPRIAERIRSEGIVLDMCPTANWKCKAVATLAEHPLPSLVRAGVRCTISTDSRTVADTTLSREFELASAMGMTDEELQRCNAVAYEAKFG
jgi:adenosine deaminase